MKKKRIYRERPKGCGSSISSSFVLSLEQQLTMLAELDDENINLALKYLSKQYPLRKGFEDTTVGYSSKISDHDSNF